MKEIIAAVCLAGTFGVAHATEYLGLDLGVATKEKVAQQLKAGGAPFEDDWGYRAYGSPHF